MKKKISIITVVKNDPIALEKTLLSLSELSNRLFELIIVDGASTDSTITILENYSKIISKQISEVDKGIYDAMNKGIQMATCEYIMFLNAGDTINSIDNFYLALKKLTNTNVNFFSVNIENEIGSIIKHPPTYIKKKHLYYSMPVCHQSIIYSKESFNKIGIFDINYKIAADYEWVVRFIFLGNKIHTHNIILSNYAIPGYSQKNKDKLLNEKYKIVNKYFYNIFKNYFAYLYLKLLQ
jgi:glycosyltransferase involved in cell wall biosynthesis